MAKSSEKPRLRQIPSSEDMEAEGTLPEAGAESSDLARARLEPARLGSSVKEPERTQKMMQPQEELVLQQVPEGWQGWESPGEGRLKQPSPFQVPFHGEKGRWLLWLSQAAWSPLGWFEAFIEARERAGRGGVPSLVPVFSRSLIALS